jgi:hypothetical protein
MSREVQIAVNASWPISVEVPLRMAHFLRYVFRVSLFNVAGYGVAGEHAGRLPTAPSFLRAVVSGPQSLTIDVGSPVNDGTFEVTHYVLLLLNSAGQLLQNASIRLTDMTPLGLWRDPPLHPLSAPAHRVHLASSATFGQEAVEVQGRARSWLGTSPSVSSRGESLRNYMRAILGPAAFLFASSLLTHVISPPQCLPPAQSQIYLCALWRPPLLGAMRCLYLSIPRRVSMALPPSATECPGLLTSRTRLPSRPAWWWMCATVVCMASASHPLAARATALLALLAPIVTRALLATMFTPRALFATLVSAAAGMGCVMRGDNAGATAASRGPSVGSVRQTTTAPTACCAAAMPRVPGMAHATQPQVAVCVPRDSTVVRVLDGVKTPNALPMATACLTETGATVCQGLLGPGVRYRVGIFLTAAAAVVWVVSV